ncbi:MAG: Unknown protein [uncultured Sulfurovum sp.]|uniref:Lipoprotein n=1 Tax=uncultured Sulfurovum sp. TaxID=269237 RepID=A0A6S6SY62_9BACT|nr:MAG: Unknown protein [uncultured Sulfurovum sp.]
MRSSSIIIFGVFSAILLIISCVSFNVSRFYNELEVATPLINLNSKPTIILRDRSSAINRSN